MSDSQVLSPEVTALVAAMASVRHPGFVTVKASFPELDGSFTTVEVSVPADADDAEIQRRLEMAARVQIALRGRFFWGGVDINPGNYIAPFGRNKGLTLAQIAESDPDGLRWLAYEASNVQPALRLAAQWVIERADGAAGGASYQAPATGGYLAARPRVRVVTEERERS